jgi:hypothetical protein
MYLASAGLEAGCELDKHPIYGNYVHRRKEPEDL